MATPASAAPGRVDLFGLYQSSEGEHVRRAVATGRRNGHVIPNDLATDRFPYLDCRRVVPYQISTGG